MAATTFYAQVAANRRNSWLLVLVVVLLLATLGWAVGYGLTGDPGGGIGLLGLAGIVAILGSLASYYGGDQLILAVSGAHEVDEQEEPVLIDVVRELALAAGVAMPRVYVIEDTAPNAFATGRDPAHASLAVTRGLLEKLDREELQGVIGHEVSHIRNLDIRFGLLVGVLVGMVALLADFFLRSAFWWGGGVGRRNRREGGGGLQALVFVVAVVLAVLAPIAARLVQLAVSRQREYLADAASVELTRNPYGLQRALAKIALAPEVLEAANRATQHLYFTNPIKRWEERASGLFSTHPPIVDRINRLRQLTGEPPLTGREVAALAGLD